MSGTILHSEIRVIYDDEYVIQIIKDHPAVSLGFRAFKNGEPFRFATIGGTLSEMPAKIAGVETDEPSAEQLRMIVSKAAEQIGLSVNG